MYHMWVGKVVLAPICIILCIENCDKIYCDSINN